MAYWLGFLFADGNINDSRAHYVVQLHLKCIDYSHVEKFKKALQSTYRLALHKNGETSESCSVTHKISDHSMAHDLIALGCTPRKSLTLKWPNNMPDEFASHFVRGYFDGDGCIHYRKASKTFTISFVGSHEFVESLRMYIKKNVLCNSKANGSLYHQRSCSQLAYEGNISSMTILTWMYKDSNSTIRLDRKYALYSKFTETANLKPKPQSEEISSFLNGRIYKTLTQCQNDRRCPHVHPIQKANKNYSQIHQVNKSDGSVIKVWKNASTIYEALGFQSCNVLKVCRGRQRSAYGYNWKFGNDHPNDAL
eukprot:368380_1